MTSDTFTFPEEETGDEPGTAPGAGIESTTRESTGTPTLDVPDERLLETDDLAVSHGSVDALTGVDLHVDRGEVVALVGPNGAGKTTFADAATGFLDYRGSITYRGTEVETYEVDELVAAGLVQCTETRDLFGAMTVEDNLRLGAYVREDDEAIEEQLDFVYDRFPRLAERPDQPARTLAGGEQAMLAVGRSLMGDPELLVLDEPTLGLSPLIVEDLGRGLDEAVEEGVTVLLAEQNVAFARDHADRLYLLENGTIERGETPETVRGEEYVRETHLGG